MFPESIITVLAITIQQVENESVRSLLAASNEGRLGSKSDLLMLIKLVRQGCNQLYNKNLAFSLEFKLTFSTINMDATVPSFDSNMQQRCILKFACARWPTPM